ncbi:helix-turn-helix domain-containing protein [Roseovarius sp. TE539]|uniref:helix-turn-helix domain-containing protein n=1 Tax=Roseovarius sp. TE539 TaxID=2249812 RepID=UPI000DDE3ABD|nr:helix-turn-helix domain-containing protein [Roseovarius sp. TE539]RBI69884.1 helix-turn-helix domain-containing protein [Roseovarius sp. TE539]
MSHAATNWAIQQRGLKPTTKIVLWHLCDRFNPDYGCFPSQDRLAHDCEIGRATLNRHLDDLETRRLIRRIRNVDARTGRQRPTRYLLGFEPDFPPPGSGDPDPASGAPFDTDTAEIPCPDVRHGPSSEKAQSCNDLSTESAPRPCLETGHGSVSQFDTRPCLKNGDSRVSFWDTNPVREPLKEEEGPRAREFDFDRFFAELLSALGFAPNATLPSWWQGWPAREHVRRWRDDLGLSAEAILAVAEETRQDHPDPPDGPKALDRAMQRAAQRQAQRGLGSQKGTEHDGKQRKRRKVASGPPPSDDELAAFYAEMVNSEQFLPANMISTTMRDAMLARGLVTADRMRERGVT